MTNWEHFCENLKKVQYAPKIQNVICEYVKKCKECPLDAICGDDDAILNWRDKNET